MTWRTVWISDVHLGTPGSNAAGLHRTDDIVCGHIHTPAINKIRHVDYYNGGDRVESRTALVEHPGGRIELVRWAEVAETALA